MTKGEATQVKVHFKGKNDDFVIFLDDLEDYKKWQNDSSVPMAQFISSFQVFITHKQGKQGQLDTAPKSTLAAEFDTEDTDEVIKKILEKGTVQVSEMTDRQGPKNDSMNSTKAK